MTDVIKNKLKERSYLTTIYYKYGKRKSDFEKLIVKTHEFVKFISAANDKYVDCDVLVTPRTRFRVNPHSIVA